MVIRATHDCMASRGVHTPGVAMVTKRLLGVFEAEPLRGDFMAAGRPLRTTAPCRRKG